MLNYIIAAFTVMQLCITYAHADNTNKIHLIWDPSPNESNLTYKVYFSPLPGSRTNFTSIVDSGTNITATVPTMDAGLPAYYSVTANRDGLESDPSNEIIFVIPLIDKKITPIGLILRFKAVPMNGNLQYLLESSDDMVTWVNAQKFITHTTLLEDGTEMQEAYVPYAKPKEFFRVKVLVR